ncbi:hypothetical protein ACT8ZV_16530 [Nocardioides sp. MAHUQ-72]|uniref:hypothetical protein n=1 Tax=unclassified Nocardioides TaxID=2615069 RepID=UPI003614DFEE
MTASRLRRTAPVLATLVAVLAVPTSASAQVEVASDPVGDAANGLDFTRVKVSNEDERIVVTATFDRARRGDLAVSIDPRGKRGLRLVSEYRPRGTTRNQVVLGAFTDGSGAKVLGKAADEGTVTCAGFRVRWNADTERARMTLPSSCLHDGDYGAIRFSYLSEDDGADVDSGPDTDSGDIGSSAWIPRG